MIKEKMEQMMAAAERAEKEMQEYIDLFDELIAEMMREEGLTETDLLDEINGKENAK